MLFIIEMILFIVLEIKIMIIVIDFIWIILLKF